MESQTSLFHIPLTPLVHFKGSPNRWLKIYSQGQASKSGLGISGLILTTSSTIVEVPTGTIACPFSQECNSLDRQLVSLSGTAIFSVNSPEKLSDTFDFSLDSRGRFQSDDPKRLVDRLSEILASVLLSVTVQRSLTDLLGPQENLGLEVLEAINKNPILEKMGISIQTISVTSIQPSPDINKALESIRAEELKKESDAAIHARQLAAELKDRQLKQEALVTGKVIQEGEREILEAKFETTKRKATLENEVQRLEIVKKDEQLKAYIRQDKEKAEGEVVVSKIKTQKVEEDSKNIVSLGNAEGQALEAKAKALGSLDAKKLQALAISGGSPGNIFAAAFLDLADKADKIGSLNITPDLLQSIIDSKESK
jgi:hypothetical protein